MALGRVRVRLVPPRMEMPLLRGPFPTCPRNNPPRFGVSDAPIRTARAQVRHCCHNSARAQGFPQSGEGRRESRASLGWWRELLFQCVLLLQCRGNRAS